MFEFMQDYWELYDDLSEQITLIGVMHIWSVMHSSRGPFY